MRGRLVDAWRFSWQDIWEPLVSDGEVPRDLFMQLYPDLVLALSVRPKSYDYDLVANDPDLARDVFYKSALLCVQSDRALARFLCAAYETIAGVEQGLSLRFAELVRAFLESRNLRYVVMEPFAIRISVVGAFASLLADIKRVCDTRPHLAEALADFEYAFRAMVDSQHEADVKTCVLKACMLTEALAANAADTTGGSLGELCGKVQAWPHHAVREAVKKLYGFCSDYPGIRHSTNQGGKLRSLELRDAAVVSLMFMASSGYFADELDFFGALSVDISQSS